MERQRHGMHLYSFGQPIGVEGIMIACIALSNGLVRPGRMGGYKPQPVYLRGTVSNFTLTWRLISGRKIKDPIDPGEAWDGGQRRIKRRKIPGN